MFTINYQDMLKKITEKIEDNKLIHKNTLIIGDNSSGKSDILKELLKDKNENYYFIDSVNRTFNFEKIIKSDGGDDSYNSVLKFRLEDNNFNLKDTFNFRNNGIGFIEEKYYNYEDELKEMLKDFLNIEFDITRVNDEILGWQYKLNIGENIDKLSSGYQAIIRLFLEILYFNDTISSESSEVVIVIDEINEFLSAKNEERILPFLTKRFEDLKFVVTTHSADVIASSIDFNIIVLSNGNYECLDGNDYCSITDVREIFEKIYSINDNKDNEQIELILRKLLNAKISGIWDKDDEETLKAIKYEKLTTSQKHIFSEIKSW